jgi:hypothetical protein
LRPSKRLTPPTDEPGLHLRTRDPGVATDRSVERLHQVELRIDACRANAASTEGGDPV